MQARERTIAVGIAVALLRLAGVPVFHDGVLIETPSGLFEVAEACAGIRFLIANLVVVTLFAHLALRRAWKWLLFLTLGLIVPVVANGLRAFGIIAIAHDEPAQCPVRVPETPQTSSVACAYIAANVALPVE